MPSQSRLLCYSLLFFAQGFGSCSKAPSVSVEQNSIGMKLIEIPAGQFIMGSNGGGENWDEAPRHLVTISHPFKMSVTEVTNAQYEQYDPDHKKLRGKMNLSREDDEAVIFINWHDAVAFCDWLSRKEDKPYRLPTEAEWEYACRAGTQTPFFTGSSLPTGFLKHQENDWMPHQVSLQVGATAPNDFGLKDMHGNVEEWCYDWYGPYPTGAQTDPVGYEKGIMKVSRGGSHNTPVRYLRSANRMGSLPEDKQWLIGFRVVQAAIPASIPLNNKRIPIYGHQVSQQTFDWAQKNISQTPFFATPIAYVKAPPDTTLSPFYHHNHCPSITWCPNGDLLAIWFSTNDEAGREMTVLASRLRAGASSWDPSSEFFKAPDRNMTGSSLFHDGKGTLYHLNGLEVSGHWRNLAFTVRTSTDNGATWSTPWFGDPEHTVRHQIIAGMQRTREGWLIQPCDATPHGSGGTALQISADGGTTWQDPGVGTPQPDYRIGSSGGTIAGIHAGVVQLKNGNLLAFGRGDNLPYPDSSNMRMPMSVSQDSGRTWIYAASEFPPIAGGQRLVLMRLQEGPLLFISFSYASDVQQPEGMSFVDDQGKRFKGFGMFAALSYDEGNSWPIKKLMTDGKKRKLNGGAWTQEFLMDATHAEPKGYLDAVQTPDGMIHLISSGIYYQFNLAWLEQPSSYVSLK